MSGDIPETGLIARVTGVIAKTQHIPSESVNIDSTFEELKIDSLDGINILFALESEFDVDIPDDAARQIRSVREMAEGIGKLVAAKSVATEKDSEHTDEPSPTPRAAE
jgi:acyl carrier protein